MFFLKTLHKYLLRPRYKVKLLSSVANMENPIVKVQQGKLKGAVDKLRDGSTYYSFKGIPYAQPPTGKLRFMAPLAAMSWEGIRDATEHGPICPQFDMNTAQITKGNEDCLYLNIYTKSITPKVKTPVMFYIHGGAYMSGSGDASTYGPEFLLQHDVVIVTINYRLEVLGFLCLEIPEVPGNAGMKDQVLALNWVKQNIHNFGGDPDNITIFGESAGAGSVSHHMLSPMSTGLFHKAITQSGCSLHDWTIGQNARERAFRLGKLLGKDTNDPYELLDFLRSLPAVKLAGTTLQTRTPDERYRCLPMHFVPVVEKKFNGVEAFISEQPINLLLKGQVNKVPLVMGYNSSEGIIMLLDQLKKKDVMNKTPSYLLAREVVHKVPDSKLKEIGESVKRFYTGDHKEFGSETLQAIVNLQTDLHFSFQTYRFADFYCKFAPIYLYRFDYDTEMNFIKTFTGITHVKGACHADDIFYLFNTEFTKDCYNDNVNIQKMVYQLTKFWTDFASSGNPTPNNDGVKWPAYTPSSKEMMLLHEQVSPVSFADKERIEFWFKIYRDVGLPCAVKSKI